MSTLVNYVQWYGIKEHVTLFSKEYWTIHKVIATIDWRACNQDSTTRIDQVVELHDNDKLKSLLLSCFIILMTGATDNFWEIATDATDNQKSWTVPIIFKFWFSKLILYRQLKSCKMICASYYYQLVLLPAKWLGSHTHLKSFPKDCICTWPPIY